MKMNTFIRKTPKGVTLIELSVVIAVILVLISVLFIGASFYRTAANRAACQINQSSIAKAGTSVMNMGGSTTVWTVTSLAAAIVDPDGPMPNGVPNDPGTTAPNYNITIASGEASVSCGDTTHNL